MSLEECERIAFPTRCYHLHPLQSESRPPAPDHSLSRQQYATAPCQCDPSVSGLPHFQSAFEPRKHDRPYYLPLHMHGEAFCPTHRWRSYQHCGSVVPGRILCSRTLQPDAERIDRRTLIEHGVDLVMSTLLDDAATFTHGGCCCTTIITAGVGWKRFAKGVPLVWIQDQILLVCRKSKVEILEV